MGWERLGQKQVLGGLSGVWVQTGELRDAWYPKRRGQAGLGPPSCLRRKLLAGDAAVGELGALHELRWEKAAGREKGTEAHALVPQHLQAGCGEDPAKDTGERGATGVELNCSLLSCFFFFSFQTKHEGYVEEGQRGLLAVQTPFLWKQNPTPLWRTHQKGLRWADQLPSLRDGHMRRSGQSESPCLPTCCDWFRNEHVTQAVPMGVISGTSCWCCWEDAPYIRVAKLGRRPPGDASGRAGCVIMGLSAKRECRTPYSESGKKVPLKKHGMLFLPSAGSLSTCPSVFYVLFHIFLSKEKLRS